MGNMKPQSMSRLPLAIAACVVWLGCSLSNGTAEPPKSAQRDPDATWRTIARFFEPPAEFADQLGAYRSPLLFDDGSGVKSAADWPRRRKEIADTWHGLMGPWLAVLEKPKVEV